MQSSNHGVKTNEKIAYPQSDNHSPLPRIYFFSSQNRNMDYVTLSGISERTGIGKNDLPNFVLKELLDNAVDFTERQGPLSKKEKSDNDKITVSFEVDSSAEQHCLILKVRNSIGDNSHQKSFDKETLVQIFDFSKYHSSKRNLFTVSRGALGDAFKEIIACTYVLARDIDRKDWNEPLIITTPTARYEVRLQIDRINQSVNSIVSELSSSIDKNIPIGQDKISAKYTEIEVHFPPKSKTDALEYVNKLRNYAIEYSFVNLHVTFEIKIDNADIAQGIEGSTSPKITSST